MDRRSFLRAGSAAIGALGAATTPPADARPHDIPSLTRASATTGFSATGFYRLEEVGGKWVMIDHEGQPVFLRGLNHYGDGTYMPLNLKERYGSVEAWRRALRERHRDGGFNYLPPSVGPSETTPHALPPVLNERGGRHWPEPVHITRTPEWKAEHFAELEFPFAPFMDVPRQYMSGPGLPDVFSAEFREMVDGRCRELVAPLADNPYLVGYHFVQNPPWHYTNNAFDLWIASIVEGEAGRREWAALMRRIYGSVERWRATYGMPISSFEEILELQTPLRGYVSERRAIEDRVAFMERVAEEWYKVFSGTIRKYDPNHLILGDRNSLHLEQLPGYALHIMGKYVDVVSVNVQGPADVFYGTLEQVTRHWDGPILLADNGAGIYNGEWAKADYQTRDLEEFGDVYGSYMQAGLEHPQLVGVAWCGYYETPSSRSGLFDSRTDEPLVDRLEVVQKWNRWMEEQFGMLVTTRR